MSWLARLVLFVPAIIAGWFVSRQDPRFWVFAMAIALVMFAMTIMMFMYLPSARKARGKRRRRPRR